MLVIGAPFGNWLRFPGAVSTLGTFTLDRRGGRLWRWWQVLRTVRYYPGIQAWKNRLGLPNPGLAGLKRVALTTPDQFAQSIVSIAGFNHWEWQKLFGAAQALQPLAIELNVSCPNCPGKDQTDYTELFAYLGRQENATWTTPVIVKLPPLGAEQLYVQALAAGIRRFHCCNTLPTPGGGLSGKPLKAISLALLRRLRPQAPPGTVFIGGGGVTTASDAMEYYAAGADMVSVASALFCPWRWGRFRRLALELRGCRQDQTPLTDPQPLCTAPRPG